MYRIPSQQITLEPFDPFYFSHDIEVNSSWKNLTDSATIKIAKNTHIKDGAKMSNILKVGQTGLIELGYDWQNKQVFKGYISSIYPEIPLKIGLEDEMWKLKKMPFSGSWEHISLHQLLNEMLNPHGIKYKTAIDADLYKLRFEKQTVAKVLQFLKEKRGLYSFFREGVLYVGTPNIHTTLYPSKQTLEYVFQRDVTASSLEYKTAEERIIKVEAISVLTNNKELKASVGDEGGETHTLHFYGIKSETELKRMAEAEMPKLRISGYKGSLTVASTKIAYHGDVAEIHDIDFPDRSGSYKIDGVIYRNGSGGFRQELILGIKVA